MNIYDQLRAQIDRAEALQAHASAALEEVARLAQMVEPPQDNRVSLAAPEREQITFVTDRKEADTEQNAGGAAERLPQIDGGASARPKPQTKESRTLHKIKSKLFGTKRRTVAVIAVIAAVVIVAAAAAAWLTIQPNSHGQGKISALTPPTVSAAAPWPGAGDLVPTGQPSGDLKVLVTNPNNSTLYLTSVELATGTFSAPGTCPAGNFSWPNPVTGSGIQPNQIPANANNLAVTISDAITLSTGAPSSCQGADYSVDGFSSTFSTSP